MSSTSAILDGDMGIFLLIVGLVLFIGLVVVHEFGHFIVARRGGVEVEEFGIFFPPRLWSRKMKGGWVFSVNLLPLGGFVKLKGEHDSDTAKGSYGAAPTWTKSKIMLAGVGMNLAAALVLFTVLAWLGMPQLVDKQFTIKSDTKISHSQVIASDVEAGSPAAKAGLKSGDKILQINHQAVKNSDDLRKLTDKYGGQTVPIVFTDNGKTQTNQTTLLTTAAVNASQKTNNPKGHLGVVPSDYTLQRSTWSAPVVAVGLSAQLTALTFQGLGHALAGLGGIFAGAFTGNHAARENAQTTASSQVSGPVGIFEILKDGSLLGYQFMLMIIAVISLTLAIMNVLPVPALDGGRLFMMLVSRLFKKQLSQKAEENIVGTGFAVLILLIIVITIVDVKRFF